MDRESTAAPPLPPAAKRQLFLQRLRTFCIWPTAPTIGELPGPAAEAVRDYPELESFFVQPPVGFSYRFAGLVAWAVGLVAMVLLGLWGYYTDAYPTSTAVDWAIAIAWGGFLAIGALIGVILAGTLADYLRMTRTFLLRVVMGSAVFAVSITVLCLLAHFTLDGDGFGGGIEDNELILMALVILFGICAEVISGFLGVELLYRIGVRLSDTMRWFWLRRAGLYLDPSIAVPPDQAEIHRVVRGYLRLGAWYLAPPMQRRYTYRILITPMVVLLVTWLAGYVNAFIESSGEMPFIMVLVAGWFYFLAWIVLAPCGVLLDLLKTPKGQLLWTTLTWIGFTVFAFGLTIGGHFVLDWDDEYIGVAFIVAILAYPFLYLIVIMRFSARAVRTHFRRQQLQTDILEDAVDPATYPLPPWQAGQMPVEETSHQRHPATAIIASIPTGQGSAADTPAAIPLPVATAPAPADADDGKPTSATDVPEANAP